MRIVEGGLPEGKAWRSLVMLSLGEELGIVWQLGLSLAQANEGQMVVAVIIPSVEGGNLVQARGTLARARSASRVTDPVYTVVIESKNHVKAIRDLIEQADIDLLLARADIPNWHSLDRMPCAVAAVRGEIQGPLGSADQSIAYYEEAPLPGRVLVPTSGGPNSAHALSFLLPLTSHDYSVTALYIANDHLGANEEALGQTRLRNTLEFVDAGNHIESRLISAGSVIDGIVDEASGEYDLVFLGASRESSLDRVLFGDIPATVVRECKKPVVVVREPTSRVGTIARDLDWAMHRIIPRLSVDERTEAYVRIRRDARPDTDFFVLIGLAAAIAALGLLANSAAVVIGAMLVAPLMSPIAGTGLAIVLGDTRFLRLALGAVFRGALLAVLMGAVVGLAPLPDPMTDEVLARTQPTLLDLAVALFSGMAVAYALSKSEAKAALPGVAIAAALVPPLASAGISFANGFPAEGAGALLLFSTNFVAISSAAALIFLILGFRPTEAQKVRRIAQLRSARVTLLFLAVITFILAATTVQLADAAVFEAKIRRTSATGVLLITDVELREIEIGNLDEAVLELELIIRSTKPISHDTVAKLQRFLTTQLERDVDLTLTVISTTEISPFEFPAEIPGEIPIEDNSLESILVDELVATEPAAATPVSTEAMATATKAAPTATLAPGQPTPTFTPTPTPRMAIVDYAFGLNLRSEPTRESTLLRFLGSEERVILLDGQETNSEGAWQLIKAGEQIGWVLADFLRPADS